MVTRPSNNQYNQQQMGGYPLIDTGYGQPMQPQFTSYNPFHMQMMQQEQQRQQEEFMRQQMLAAEQQRQQEEYMRQQYLLQQQQQQQAMMGQQTGYGSNNPFAPSTSFLSSQNNPGMNMPQQQQQPQQSFLPVPTVQQQAPSSPKPPSPQPQPQMQPPKPVVQKDDGQHAGLAALLARGREDGLDTFGNVGNLRK